MLSEQWQQLFGVLPGYDPLADPGDCRFDERAAGMALAFFEECLTHTKGELAGKPFVLEDWQRAIIGALFGWKRPDGTRRYREAFVSLPRKNGKSMVCAGIVNYIGFCDDEPGAEIYSAAGEREQAALIMGMVKAMIRAEPELSRRARIYQHAVVFQETMGSYKAISADAGTKHGFNSHCVVVDELHVQKNRELVDVLTTSTGARRQPLIVHITTAGWDRHSICREKYDYACKVRDGVIGDQSFLPIIYEAAPEADWRDEATWAKANPNLGVSVSLEYLRREFKRACEIPAYENTFKRLHLNIWTEQASRWLSLESWDACAGQIDLAALVGRPCHAAIDLASRVDLCALVLDFPMPDGSHVWLPFYWLPSDSAIKRERKDRVPYPLWIKEEFIEQTPGNVVDFEFIRARVNELGKRYRIRDVALDPWNATHMMTLLQDDGFNVVEYRQGYKSMSPPAKELERLVLCKKLVHGGNPVLRWNAANVTISQDPAGNIKPDKAKSTERIDGIVAGLMALGRSMVTPASKPSVYETRGVLSVSI